MADKPTLADQYKMLRDEIVQHVNEIYRSQLWAVIAAVSVYSWLSTQAKITIPAPAWYIPPATMLICLIRCVDLSARIRHIAVYLRRIEEDSFLDNPNLRGWEHFKVDTKWIDTRTNTIAGIFWVLAIAGSIFTSFYLSTHPPKTKDSSEPNAAQASTNSPANKP